MFVLVTSWTPVVRPLRTSKILKSSLQTLKFVSLPKISSCKCPMTYSLDVIGTFRTFVASAVGKVAAVANIDQVRKRSDGPSMEFRLGGGRKECIKSATSLLLYIQ
jgi:hypothetical protein